jgi:CheY-like chemotaxis protein
MPRRLLVADDDIDTTRLLQIQLKNAGYQTSIALDGLAALQMFEEVRPDLVILDIMLPGLNGIEVCRQLRRMPRGATVPVLLLTARSEIEMMQAGFAAGADDYITKPFRKEELLLRVQSHLARADRLNVASRLVEHMPIGATYLADTVEGIPHSIKPFSGNTPTVSVVIPTFNEAANLPYVLPRIPDWIDEIVIVDGRSTDNTIEVAKNICPRVKIVMEEHPGKGAALRAGFSAAIGDILVMLDADGSTNPYEIPAFVGALISGADYAKGTRFAQGGGTWDMPPIRRLANLGFVLLVKVFFGGNFTDLCYGYNAFWTRCLPQLNLDTDGFEIETTMNVHALRSKLSITEVPSFEAPRLFGSPKLRAIPDGWRVIKTILSEALKKLWPRHNKEDIDGQPSPLIPE